MKKQLSTFLLLSLFIISFSGLLSAQTYGLDFLSHDVSKDKRTQLDLTPNSFFEIRDEFELVFKMTIYPNKDMYFGYIVRIIDEEEHNVDLIFNYNSSLNNSIDIIYGQDQTNISVKSNFSKLSTEWVEYRLVFNLQNQTVTFATVDTTITAGKIVLNKKIKILFGASDYNHFKTTDVPPMNIRDIRIFEKGKLSHHWPLDESEGNSATDIIRKKNAVVTNPKWLKPLFCTWEKCLETVIGGNAQVAFNPIDEKVYIVGNDQMKIYSVKENRIETLDYKNDTLNFLPGCQAFFDTIQNLLISYYIDLKNISSFDFLTGRWNFAAPSKPSLTVFWHHNKYYSAHDSTLIVIGGYGQHEYKNLVQRYSFSSEKWDTLVPSGDVFYPRYLAASGARNDTLYFLGGYGSISGKQILSPKSYSDLMMFSLKDQKFIKKYEFQLPIEDIAFANSMVFDLKLNEYYALAFPVFNYGNYLQLVKGSLSKPEMELVGSKIPYLFHDIFSFADLFYCQSSKKLITVTLHTDEKNQTLASIFTIDFPPNKIVSDSSVFHKQKIKPWIYILGLGLLVILIFTVGYFKRKSNSVIKSSLAKKSKETILAINAESECNKEIKNTVFFFGGFQIYNAKGDDITHKFTPLIKELFLIIWLYTVKDKGISSEKLLELLWFDKEEKSAKNNLSVNIAKLKQLLNEITSCQLSRQTGYWKISFNEDHLFNDYTTCLNLCRRKKHLDKQEVLNLIDLTRRGHFFDNSNYEWLDEFKADISNNIIDALIDFSSRIKVESDPDFILHLADSVFNFDIINEEAMILKCHALVEQGKFRLAKDTFTKFEKDYASLYGITYEKTFKVIAGLNNI